MVLGARTLQDKGCVLHYVSDDLENWTFLEKYTADDMGYMWECPDEFVIDGHRFLSISPQGLVHGKYDNQNVYSSGYYRMENGVLTDFTEWDKGFDFYAPQSFEAPDGRRILFGWEGIGDIPYTNPTTELGWQHCLTLPRELTVTDYGKIQQNPVRELDSLRINAAPINSGDTVKIDLPFDLAAKVAGDIKVRFDNILQLLHQNGEFHLEFLSDSASGGRDVRYADIPELRDIRIIADKASVEVYINCGETVMSARMYPEDTEITLSAEGINGTLYELDGIEVISDE